MSTVTAFVPVAGRVAELGEAFTCPPERWLTAGSWTLGPPLGSAGGLVRPVVLDLPDAPTRIAGRLELRLSARGPMLLLHASYQGRGDALRTAVHGHALAFLTETAAGLDPVQARLRARRNHPSSGRVQPLRSAP